MEDLPHLSQIQTLWSVVRQAHGNHTYVQDAQQELLDRYGGAVRRYALAALRDEDAAEEVFQEFALKFVRGDFGKVAPERGKFRAYVKTIVYRLIVDYQRRRKARARAGPLHENIADSADSDLPENAVEQEDDAPFRASWRAQLLERCWQRLELSEITSGKPHHTVLRHRVDHPDAHSPALAAGLSEKLGKPITAGAVRVLLHRARDAFAELLFEEIAHSLTEQSLDEIEEELIDLNLLEYCRPALEQRRGH